MTNPSSYVGAFEGPRSTAATSVHSERISHLVPDLPAPLAERLAKCPRLSDRLSRMVMADHGLGEDDGEIAKPDMRLADCSADRLLLLGDFAGGVWHAQSVRRLILGRDLKDALSTFDPRLRTIALRNLDVSLTMPDALGGTALAAAIRRDGMKCLDAWLAGLPSGVRMRVLLKFSSALPLGKMVAPGECDRQASVFLRVAGQVFEHDR